MMYVSLYMICTYLYVCLCVNFVYERVIVCVDVSLCKYTCTLACVCVDVGLYEYVPYLCIYM